MDPVDESEDEDNFSAVINLAEEQFYRGSQVDWLNYFSHHVCPRKIHLSLLKQVEDALEGKDNIEDDKILITYLFHQPGAGGTTSARHILWSLRDRYRCCIVREIKDPNQTADQLKEIFLFKDESPKPILVLLDNEDEDKVFQLRVNLAEITREYDDRFSDIFCVLLICSRMVGVPIAKRGCSMEYLEQSLDKQERAWFDKRYKDLKRRYTYPKSLISFNILKENFNTDYLKNTVKEFLAEVKDPKEQKILKIVSFINKYDLDFKFIHVSCFDAILELRPVFDNGTRKTCWEANVSQSFKVLMNLSSKSDMRKMKTIRLFSKLTAEHILNCTTENSGESVIDILSSLLTDKIFSATGQEMKKFQIIISNIVKKRALKECEFKKGTFRKEKFSQFILDIKNCDTAGEIMESLFQLNNDPFTAQQVARFYMEFKNYKKAEEYAEKATALLPRNSFLWDTYAQVFRYQLFEKYQSCCQTVDAEFTGLDLQEVIYLCQRCTELFKKEQLVSEKEAKANTADINRAGYFGELRSILLLLSSAEKCKCFGSKEIMHRFLVDENYTNEELSFLSKEETAYLKKIFASSKETLRKVEDEFLQTKVEIQANPFIFFQDESNQEVLFKMHVSLNEYFGESSNEIPHYFEEGDKRCYRSRLVFSKKCNSLYGALKLKHNQEFEVLRQCYDMIHQNVMSLNSTMDDFRILLGILTVFVTEVTSDSSFPIDFDEIISWTKILFQHAKDESNEHLEPFLYFTLYNFPTDERLEYDSLACPQDLKTVMKHWREVFIATKNLPRLTHRETTLFFLGNGQPPRDIVYQKYLDNVMSGIEVHKKWQSPEISYHLRLLSGVLSDKGDYVAYQYKTRQGNANSISIKTISPIKKRAWLQKKVYFYLGFSFSGLKAYGITDTKPSLEKTQHSISDGPMSRLPSGGQLKSKKTVLSVRELQEKKKRITQEIEKRKRQCRPHGDLIRDLQEVNNDVQELFGFVN